MQVTENRLVSKLFFFIFYLFLIFGCAHSERAPASKDIALVDIVFDLDWTLVKQVDGPVTIALNFFEINGEFYRLGDGAVDLLEFLFSRKDVRVSFFSGGSADRNNALLKKVKTKYGSAYDNAYKVLSFNDLLEVSTDESLPFSERLKKDISLINNNLDNVLLVDDDKRFIVGTSQKRNLLWMGETYKHFEHFSDVHNFDDIYAPKTESQWLYDRKKLLIVRDILKNSLDGQEDFLESVERESQQWDFGHNIPTLSQEIRFFKKPHSSSCQKIMTNFISIQGQ